jgi:hypothetical protein
MVDARTPVGEGTEVVSPSVTGIEKFRREYVQDVVALVIVLTMVVVFLRTAGAVTETEKEQWAFVAIVLASLAVGALVGFVVGGPGAETGTDGTDKANREGWGGRLGVFGTWLTGAAFALAIANAGAIAGWFASMTASISAATGAGPEPGAPDALFQFAIGAWMVIAAAAGFAVGFMQMATTGRRLLAQAQQQLAEVTKVATAFESEAQQQTAQVTKALTDLESEIKTELEQVLSHAARVSRSGEGEDVFSAPGSASLARRRDRPGGSPDRGGGGAGHRIPSSDEPAPATGSR